MSLCALAMRCKTHTTVCYARVTNEAGTALDARGKPAQLYLLKLLESCETGDASPWPSSVSPLTSSPLVLTAGKTIVTPNNREQIDASVLAVTRAAGPTLLIVRLLESLLCLKIQPRFDRLRPQSVYCKDSIYLELAVNLHVA